MQLLIINYKYKPGEKMST